MNTPPALPRLVVAHSVSRWLDYAGEWIYNQVTGTPEDIEAHVVCDVALNRDRYPFARVHTGSDAPATLLLDRVLRKIFFRRHRSLLDKVVRECSVDLVHSHFAQAGWQNARYARRLGLRHVVSCYGEDMTKLPTSSSRWRSRYLEMFEAIDAILCEGPYMAATVERLGCPWSKIRTHPLGVDLQRIPCRPRSPDAGRPLRILMAAVFREKKGLAYAVNALGLLARRGIPFEATLVGDARPSDDPVEKRRIFAILDQFDIRDRVRLAGMIEHDALLEVAYRHDIFLSPSVTASDGDAEGGAPVSIIEMAASGMPIVSTRHCDIPFVLAPPNREMLVAERDPEALADVIERLLLEVDWGPLISENRSRIEQLQDARRQALELGRIYREVAT